MGELFHIMGDLIRGASPLTFRDARLSLMPLLEVVEVGNPLNLSPTVTTAFEMTS